MNSAYFVAALSVVLWSSQGLTAAKTEEECQQAHADFEKYILQNCTVYDKKSFLPKKVDKKVTQQSVSAELVQKNQKRRWDSAAKACGEKKRAEYLAEVATCPESDKATFEKNIAEAEAKEKRAKEKSKQLSDGMLASKMQNQDLTDPTKTNPGEEQKSPDQQTANKKAGEKEKKPDGTEQGDDESKKKTASTKPEEQKPATQCRKPAAIAPEELRKHALLGVDMENPEAEREIDDPGRYYEYDASNRDPLGVKRATVCEFGEFKEPPKEEEVETSTVAQKDSKPASTTLDKIPEERPPETPEKVQTRGKMNDLGMSEFDKPEYEGLTEEQKVDHLRKKIKNEWTEEEREQARQIIEGDSNFPGCPGYARAAPAFYAFNANLTEEPSVDKKAAFKKKSLFAKSAISDKETSNTDGKYYNPRSFDNRRHVKLGKSCLSGKIPKGSKVVTKTPPKKVVPQRGTQTGLPIEKKPIVQKQPPVQKQPNIVKPKVAGPPPARTPTRLPASRLPQPLPQPSYKAPAAQPSNQPRILGGNSSSAFRLAASQIGSDKDEEDPEDNSNPNRQQRGRSDSYSDQPSNTRSLRNRYNGNAGYAENSGRRQIHAAARQPVQQEPPEEFYLPGDEPLPAMPARMPASQIVAMYAPAPDPMEEYQAATTDLPVKTIDEPIEEEPAYDDIDISVVEEEEPQSEEPSLLAAVADKLLGIFSDDEKEDETEENKNVEKDEPAETEEMQVAQEDSTEVPESSGEEKEEPGLLERLGDWATTTFKSNRWFGEDTEAIGDVEYEEEEAYAESDPVFDDDENVVVLDQDNRSLREVAREAQLRHNDDMPTLEDNNIETPELSINGDVYGLTY